LAFSQEKQKSKIDELNANNEKHQSAFATSYYSTDVLNTPILRLRYVKVIFHLTLCKYIVSGHGKYQIKWMNEWIEIEPNGNKIQMGKGKWAEYI
jgi:hypothetical protein